MEKRRQMKKFKKPFLFSAAMLPLIVAAVILTAFYQIQLYPSEIIAGAINQLGSKTARKVWTKSIAGYSV